MDILIKNQGIWIKYRAKIKLDSVFLEKNIFKGDQVFIYLFIFFAS